MNPLVKPFDRPWFQRIKQAENNKSCQPPAPFKRNQRQHQQHRDNFIPNDTAVILNAQFPLGITANADTPKKQGDTQ